MKLTSLICTGAALAFIVPLAGCGRPPTPDTTVTESGLAVRWTESDPEGKVLGTSGDWTFTWSDLLAESPVIREQLQLELRALTISTYQYALSRALAGGPVKNLVIFAPPPGVSAGEATALEKVLATQNLKPEPKLILSAKIDAGRNYAFRKDDGIIATLDGQDLRHADVQNPWLYAIEESTSRLILRQLEEKLVRHEVLRSATEAGLSLQQFIDEKILRGHSLAPTDADLQSKLQALNLREADLDEAAKKNLRATTESDLREREIQRYVKDHRGAATLQLRLPPGRINLPEDPAEVPVSGSASAPVRVVVLSSFFCGDCAKLKSILEFADQHRADVELRWRPSFSRADGLEKYLADHLLCLQRSHPKKAPKLFAFLLQQTAPFNPEKLTAWIQSENLGSEEFSKCVSSQPAEKALLARQGQWTAAESMALPLAWTNHRLAGTPFSSGELERITLSQIDSSFVGRIQAFWRKILSIFQ